MKDYIFVNGCDGLPLAHFKEHFANHEDCPLDIEEHDEESMRLRVLDLARMAPGILVSAKEVLDESFTAQFRDGVYVDRYANPLSDEEPSE